MKIPKSYFFKESFSRFKLQTKKDKYYFALKQAGYLSLGASLLVNEGSFFLPALPFVAITQGTAALGSVIKQPFKNRLRDILQYYKISFKDVVKNKFNWKIVAPIAAFTGALIYNEFDLIAPPFIEWAQQGTLPSYKEFSFASLNMGFMYEVSTIMYKQFYHGNVLRSLFFNKQFYKDSLLPYVSSKESTSTIETLTRMDYLLKEEPERGLAKVVEIYYDKGITISSPVKNLPEKHLFHVFGKNSLSSFVNSIVGYGLSNHTKQFFEKAKEEALEEKNISTVTLLGLYDYKETGFTDLFDVQLDLILNNPESKAEVLARGTSTTALTHGYENEYDVTRMYLVRKFSKEHKRLYDKKIVTNTLAKNHSNNANEILNLSKHYVDNDLLSISAELKLLDPLLYDMLSVKPELFLDLNFLLKEFRKTLENSQIQFNRVDFLAKYLTNPLLSSSLYEQTIYEANNYFKEIDKDVILLDPYTKNYSYGDHIVGFDFENKGRGPEILDLLTMYDFSQGCGMFFQQLIHEKDKGLDIHKIELGLNDSDFDRLILFASGYRMKSHFQARIGDDFDEETRKVFYQEQKSQLIYYGKVFDYHRHHSTQPVLAKKQLTIASSLLAKLQ